MSRRTLIIVKLSTMNVSLSQLLPAVIFYVTERGGYVTKTKLLKLLYLFDVEFYRVHGLIFTGFEWKFFHLGPWTSEFDVLLDELVTREAVVETKSAKSDYETKFYRASEPVDLSSIFEKYSDQAILRAILDAWGDSTTGEILDHVYFRTEPMEHGIRNQPLDFTRIVQRLAEKYVRTSSGKTAKEISEARRRIREALETKVAGEQRNFVFTPPKYDQEFLAALEKMDHDK
jgi:hypothetical protein